MKAEESEHFPYPFPMTGQAGQGPDLGSQNQCMSMIRDYQRQGYISDCVHAKATLIHQDASGNRTYGVRCACDSFEIRRRPRPTMGPVFDSTAFGFYGCPRGCHFRRGRWRDRLVKLGNQLHFFRWFGRQQWQVKVAVLLVPLVAFLIYRGPEAIHAVADLVKAVWK